MSDHKITVKFVAPDETTWSFSVKTTKLKEKGTITLEAAPGSLWSFEKANLIPLSWPQKVQADGQKLVITDTFRPPLGSWEFTVTVADDANGTAYTSPLHSVALDAGVPPIIQNDGSKAKRSKAKGSKAKVSKAKGSKAKGSKAKGSKRR